MSLLLQTLPLLPDEEGPGPPAALRGGAGGRGGRLGLAVGAEINRRRTQVVFCHEGTTPIKVRRFTWALLGSVPSGIEELRGSASGNQFFREHDDWKGNKLTKEKMSASLTPAR